VNRQAADRRRAAARAGQAIGRMVRLPVGLVHVREDGPPDAPVVLLLHGFASSMHSFDRVTPLLAPDRRVVRIDLLGHGSTTAAVPDLGSQAQAAMVTAVLDRLGLAPNTVVGHSFGADVAIAVAAADDESAARVVVIGQAPDYSTARLPRGSALLRHPVAGPWLHRLALAAAVNRASRFAFAPGAPAGSYFDREDRRVLDYRATAPAMDRTVLVDRPRLLAARGLDQQLRDLGRPALVILGRLDRL
jgi:pimeloyl-ACP methyl ester carboxylesterase